MIKKRPELDTKNPPGQVREWDGKPPRYLREVIKAAQERSSERFPGEPAPLPPVDWENRYKWLVGALTAYSDSLSTGYVVPEGTVRAALKSLLENT